MTLHQHLGHPSEDITRSTGRKMGLNMKGAIRHCEGCGIGKMRQKNMNKEHVPRANTVGDRMFMDISSIKHKSAGGSKFWALFMDDHSGFLISRFLKQKSDLAEQGSMLIKVLGNQQRINVKIVRCDNAGENKKMEEACAKMGLATKFEYTAVGTPQQNGRVERKFATLYGRIRSMMISAGIKEGLRQKLWAEAANMCVDLDNILVKCAKEKSPYEIFHKAKKSPNYVNNLRQFGEVGFVLKRNNKIKSKISDRGKKAIMVGYVRNSTGDTYRMYNLRTNKITNTRDVKWAGKLYKDMMVKETDQSDYYTASDEDNMNSDDNDNLEGQPRKNDNRLEGQVRRSGRIQSQNDTDEKVMRALRKLNVSYNPIMSGMAFADEVAFVGGTDESYDNPEQFQEAWNHPKTEEREYWREAIRKEFNDMIKRKVWRETRTSEIPENRRLIGSKWVFKKKRNGVYRARLVGLGYSQIAGVDHKDNFSPVVTDTTFRCVLVMALLEGWNMEVVDIETAFLYGILDEEIFMKMPEGLDIYLDTNFSNHECLVLDKAIYGLVQAARQFHRRLTGVMEKNMGFAKCMADECLLCRTTEKGMIVVCVYIDDTLCVGKTEAIQEFKDEIKQHFAIKEEGEMREYVGCKVKRTGEKSLIMYQDDLINKIDRIFGEKAIKLQIYGMPAGTGEHIKRPDNEETLIEKAEQSLFRSGVGLLLYLVKFSRPDLSNAVRELSKVMDGATPAHMKKLMRAIKYVLDTKERVLNFEVKKQEGSKWTLKAFSDSDWAGAKDDRRSITGYCIYLNGCLVSWKSRGQKHVTLSSTEAEYVAVAEACTDIMFIRMITEFLQMEVKKPVTVFCDNVGAIFMGNNAKQSVRTKHIDVKYHFIREHIVDGVVEIVFVPSQENDADIFTKNVGKETYLKHSEKFMTEK